MSTDQPLVVTTRSKLRSLRFLPAMLNATLSIRRQLEGADGVVRWASIIAGPTEFWTISAWDSRHRMQEFMRSDAHGRWMWRFSDWLSSFWLMRWRPGPRQVGHWDGLEVGPGDVDPGAPPDVPRPVLTSMRETMPALYDALGPDGAASYRGSARARRARRYVRGARGVIVRIAVPTPRLPTVVRELRHVRRGLRSDDRLVGCAVGVGRRHEAYLLGVWRDDHGAVDLLESDWVRDAQQRFGASLWISDWLPESEFGHWDGARLRRDRRVGRETSPGRRV